MKIKIMGQSPKIFQRNLNEALNLATFISQRGRILSEKMLQNGIWARKQINLNRYDLYLNTDRYFAYIEEQTATSIVLDFKYICEKEDSFGRACVYAILFGLKYNAQIIEND